jgi:hypothetical protein
MLLFEISRAPKTPSTFAARQMSAYVRNVFSERPFTTSDEKGRSENNARAARMIPADPAQRPNKSSVFLIRITSFADKIR